MKRYEDHDLGPDRGIEFETDDEENLAETDGGTTTEEDDSQFYASSHSSSNPSNAHLLGPGSTTRLPWPQSYRQSMDMYTRVATPPIGFLNEASLTARSSSFCEGSAHRRSHLSEPESFPLLTKSPVHDTETSLLLGHRKSLASSGIEPSDITKFPRHQHCSFAQAVLNGTNVLCGIGLLTIPFAIKEGGWSSLLLLILFGIICCYTGILLKRCLESCSGLRTYPDIGQAAYGTAGRIIIAIALYIELYATCVEFMIMMSDNLSSMFPNARLSFSGLYLSSHQVCAIGSALIVLPTVWLRNLSILAYLSAGGVVASLLVVLCLLWVGTVDQVGFHQSGTLLNINNLPVTIGMVGFCYGGHSVFPNIYSSMTKPSQFPWVLILSYAICCFLYTGVAVCGVLMFGDSVSSQFTLNMPKQFVASKIATSTMVFSPITKYALTITPVSLCLEELLPSTTSPQFHCVSMIIRSALVISTLVVAMTVPFFGSLMAFIGSFLAMFVAIIFPCACYLRIFGGRLTKLQASIPSLVIYIITSVIAVCAFTIAVGFVSACLGTYSAVGRIAENVT